MWNIQDYKENFSVSEVYHFKYSGRRKAGISLGLVEVNPVRMIIWKLWRLMTIFFKINYQANWSWCLDYLTLEIKFFFFYDQDLKFGCLLNFPSCYQKKKKVRSRGDSKSEVTVNVDCKEPACTLSSVCPYSTEHYSESNQSMLYCLHKLRTLKKGDKTYNIYGKIINCL